MELGRMSSAPSGYVTPFTDAAAAIPAAIVFSNFAIAARMGGYHNTTSIL